MRRLGDGAYAAVLADHHRLVRDALVAAGGREVVNQGDGFFATFTSPTNGVAAAVEIQRSMAGHDWPDGVEPRVRIGVHVGEASATDAGLVGYEVHRAARVAAVGYGGQILLSAAAAGLVESGLDAEWGLRDLGTHRLKDLGRPETIFQLIVPGLRDAFPPLRSLDNPELPNNLPASLSPFIGRLSEVAELVAAVERARLVTLTGAGGSGKTRLALQAAAELLDGSGEGVWLVELAPLTDQADVAPAILRALETHSEAGESPADAIVRALRSQLLLLILDNCEHVVDEVAKLTDLITRNCPRVKLLATSREPLGVDGEEVFRVRSMALPGGEVTGVEDVAGIDAVDLFVTRARAHDRDFVLTDEGAVVVASICVRLDGIPLAIELAAARTATMSLADLHDRLDQRFRLLTGGSRNVLPRQQTLAATVAWSYDLLTEVERSVLRRLTVFVDGFDLAAAEAVCAEGEIESFDVDQILASLANKNLVGVERDSDQVRYRLLETVRQFAADQFVIQGATEVEAVRRRHADHFLALAEVGGAKVRRGETAKWLRRFAVEWGNLRAGIQFLLDSDRGADAARVLAAVEDYMTSNSRSDVLDLIDSVIAASRNAPPAVRARVQSARTAIWFFSRDDQLETVERAYRELADVVALAREAADAEAEVTGLVGLMFGARRLGLPGVANMAERAEELATTTGDRLIEGYALIARSLLVDLSSSAMYISAEAMPYRLASLERFREVGSMVDVVQTLVFLSVVTTDDDASMERFLAMTREVAAIAHDIGATRTYKMSMGNLAVGHAMRGEFDQAATYLNESLRWLRTAGAPPSWTGFAALTASSVFRSRGDLVRAAELAGAAASLTPERESFQFRWAPAEIRWRDENREALRAALGEEFDPAFTRGAALSPEQAIDLASGRRAPGDPAGVRGTSR